MRFFFVGIEASNLAAVRQPSDCKRFATKSPAKKKCTFGKLNIKKKCTKSMYVLEIESDTCEIVKFMN